MPERVPDAFDELYDDTIEAGKVARRSVYYVSDMAIRED